MITDGPAISLDSLPWRVAAPEGARLGDPTAAAAQRDAGASLKQSDREAILVSLYAERREVLRRQRLEPTNVADRDYLQDLSRYIDQWEMAEVRAEAKNEIWDKLEAIAAALLDTQATVERRSK
jgi:hypothetical protein